MTFSSVDPCATANQPESAAATIGPMWILFTPKEALINSQYHSVGA